MDAIPKCRPGSSPSRSPPRRLRRWHTPLHTHPPAPSGFCAAELPASQATNQRYTPETVGGKADKGADKQGGGDGGLLPLCLPPSRLGARMLPVRPLLPFPILGRGSEVPSRAIHSPALGRPYRMAGWPAGCVSGERPRHLRFLSPSHRSERHVPASPRCHTWRGRPVGTAGRLGLAAAPLHPGCRWPELQFASQRP